jgi:hypothetical protein
VLNSLASISLNARELGTFLHIQNSCIIYYYCLKLIITEWVYVIDHTNKSCIIVYIIWHLMSNKQGVATSSYRGCWTTKIFLDIWKCWLYLSQWQSAVLHWGSAAQGMEGRCCLATHREWVHMWSCAVIMYDNIIFKTLQNAACFQMHNVWWCFPKDYNTVAVMSFQFHHFCGRHLIPFMCIRQW